MGNGVQVARLKIRKASVQQKSRLFLLYAAREVEQQLAKTYQTGHRIRAG